MLIILNKKKNTRLRIVEVNPFFKSEIAFSDYKKVPIMVVNGEQVNESNAIISRLQRIYEEHSRDQENNPKSTALTGTSLY